MLYYLLNDNKLNAFYYVPHIGSFKLIFIHKYATCSSLTRKILQDR